jgi:hypothetical protein
MRTFGNLSLYQANIDSLVFHLRVFQKSVRQELREAASASLNEILFSSQILVGELHDLFDALNEERRQE